MQQKVNKISERHAKYVKQGEKIEKQLGKLFDDCKKEQKKLGIENNTAKCNELWKKKYQKRYDNLMRLGQQAYKAAWYTSSTVSRKAKVANHRSTVAKTRTQKGKK